MANATKSAPRLKIRRGDLVEVLTGKDVGRRGKVLEVIPTEGRLIVEPGLAQALTPFESPLGYLDFETVARAVPVWDGLAPWGAAVAQFSYHERQPDGTYTHAAFLAEGPQDARPPLAAAMVRATAKAERIGPRNGICRSRAVMACLRLSANSSLRACCRKCCSISNC